MEEPSGVSDKAPVAQVALFLSVILPGAAEGTTVVGGVDGQGAILAATGEPHREPTRRGRRAGQRVDRQVLRLVLAVAVPEQLVVQALRLRDEQAKEGCCCGGGSDELHFVLGRGKIKELTG